MPPWPVRSACPADLPSLVRVDELASLNPWSEAQFSGSCQPDGEGETALVVDKQGEIVGFLIFSAVLDEASILTIAVDPQCQRQGVAAQLISSGVAAMAKRGVKVCYLEVRESNHAAQALYIKFGFSRDGVRKNYYRSGDGREHAILMSRQC